VGTSKLDKERSHEAIVHAAAASVREKGLGATSVGDVMAAVGLTHGGFYAHFASRDGMLLAAVERAFSEGRDMIESLVARRRSESRMASFASIYLSKLHIGHPEVGCAAAALAVDAARSSPEVSGAFADGISTYLAALEADFGGGDHASEDAALLLSALVGAVALSRGMGANTLAGDLPKRVEAALKRRVIAEVP
jgi:TetR/AcrR family transcriptional regulator, transcriptional repressor for nem operon